MFCCSFLKASKNGFGLEMCCAQFFRNICTSFWEGLGVGGCGAVNPEPYVPKPEEAPSKSKAENGESY